MLLCATTPDALVTEHRHLIPIPTFSALYLPLQHSHDLPVPVTPVIDVEESNGGVLSHLGPRHCHENGHQHLPA